MDLQSHVDSVEKQTQSTHNQFWASKGALGDLEARLAVQFQENRRLWEEVQTDCMYMLDEQEFEKYKTSIDKQIRLLNNQVTNEENRTRRTRKKVKNMKSTIQLSISENLHNVLERGQKKRFAKFEADKFDEFMNKHPPKDLEQ